MVLQLFENLLTASFIKRENRFVVTCQLNGNAVQAYLPNPGRLWELLFPGGKLFLIKNKKPIKMHYTVAAVDKNGSPVLLHTHLTNKIAEYLINNKCIKEIIDYSVYKSEAVHGQSRFDFLLKNDHEDKYQYLEVKSCSLFHKNIAMFPDAPTVRGQKHVKELMGLSENKTECSILFIIPDNELEYFLPEFHTDPAFAETLYHARNKINIIPLGIKFNKDLSINTKNTQQLIIPWHIYDNFRNNKGNYLLIIEL